MGIHSDSVYKDTTPNISAENELLEDLQANYKRIMNLAELELEGSDGNIFAKVEDTADGGKLTIYSETGTVKGEMYIDPNGNLHIRAPAGTRTYLGGAGGDDMFLAGRISFRNYLDIGGEEIRDPPNVVANDSMTANPETDTEDGYIEVNIGGTIYQIPIYTS